MRNGNLFSETASERFSTSIAFLAPECCVPAFIHSALLMKGIKIEVPEALPSLLGVQVHPDQLNPLHLAVADNENPAGIRAADAEREINRLFDELRLPLFFRHVPFLEVSLGLWEDTLDEALLRDVVVGVGLDLSILTKRSAPRSAHHVMRVLKKTGNQLDLVDDSGEAVEPSFKLSMDQVTQAVLAIPDGLWLVGNESELQLPFTLAWKNHR